MTEERKLQRAVFLVNQERSMRRQLKATEERWERVAITTSINNIADALRKNGTYIALRHLDIMGRLYRKY